MHKWKKEVAALRRQRGITKSCLSSQSFRSLARQESRNESIGSDHLSEQAVRVVPFSQYSTLSSAPRNKPSSVRARSNPEGPFESPPEIVDVAESHRARYAFHRALGRGKTLPRLVQAQSPHK